MIDELLDTFLLGMKMEGGKVIYIPICIPNILYIFLFMLKLLEGGDEDLLIIIKDPKCPRFSNNLNILIFKFNLIILK